MPRPDGTPDGAGTAYGEWVRRTLTVAAVGAPLIALWLALWQVAPILLLIFASLLLAILLRAFAEFISRHTPMNLGGSLAAVVLMGFGALALLGVGYGPSIADGFYQLSQQLPATLHRIRDGLGQYPWGPPLLDRLSKLGGGLSDPQQLSRIAGIFSNAFGALGSVLVVLVLGIYFAADPKLYREGFASLFPPARRGRVNEALGRVGHGLRWWLLGRISTMLMVGVLTGSGLALLGVPFAFILGLLAAILDFMPNIGPLIAAVPALLTGLGQGGATVWYVALLYFVIQSLEGYVIEPLIEQRIVSMPPALLLVAQLVMGAGFGILGVLLAPPLAVVALILVRMLYLRDTLGEPVNLS